VKPPQRSVGRSWENRTKTARFEFLTAMLLKIQILYIDVVRIDKYFRINRASDGGRLKSSALVLRNFRLSEP
jgi:hypothetical protein